MNWKKLSQKAEYIAPWFKWISVISALAAVLGQVSNLLDWGKQGPFASIFVFLKTHVQILWLSALTAIAFALFIWISKLHKRFVSGFKDNFEGDLHINWDFVGPWRIAEENTLLVTGSDPGGITKVGAQWENYVLKFKARILRDCLGVIVRAQDLNNYYMFQIRTDMIRPHRRAAYPIIDPSPISNPEASRDSNTVTINRIIFQVGWEVFNPPVPLYHQLNDWFDVKIAVRGESVFIYINDDLVLQQESFLKIPTGKVGFRNDGNETGLVKKVRVTIQP